MTVQERGLVGTLSNGCYDRVVYGLLAHERRARQEQ